MIFSFCWSIKPTPLPISGTLNWGIEFRFALCVDPTIETKPILQANKYRFNVIFSNCFFSIYQTITLKIGGICNEVLSNFKKMKDSPHKLGFALPVHRPHYDKPIQPFFYVFPQLQNRHAARSQHYPS